MTTTQTHAPMVSGDIPSAWVIDATVITEAPSVETPTSRAASELTIEESAELAALDSVGAGWPAEVPAGRWPWRDRGHLERLGVLHRILAAQISTAKPPPGTVGRHMSNHCPG